MVKIVQDGSVSEQNVQYKKLNLPCQELDENRIRILLHEGRDDWIEFDLSKSSMEDLEDAIARYLHEFGETPSLRPIEIRSLTYWEDCGEAEIFWIEKEVG